MTDSLPATPKTKSTTSSDKLLHQHETGEWTKVPSSEERKQQRLKTKSARTNRAANASGALSSAALRTGGAKLPSHNTGKKGDGSNKSSSPKKSVASSTKVKSTSKMSSVSPVARRTRGSGQRNQKVAAMMPQRQTTGDKNGSNEKDIQSRISSFMSVKVKQERLDSTHKIIQREKSIKSVNEKSITSQHSPQKVSMVQDSRVIPVIDLISDTEEGKIQGDCDPVTSPIKGETTMPPMQVNSEEDAVNPVESQATALPNHTHGQSTSTPIDGGINDPHLSDDESPHTPVDTTSGKNSTNSEGSGTASFPHPSGASIKMIISQKGNKDVTEGSNGETQVQANDPSVRENGDPPSISSSTDESNGIAQKKDVALNQQTDKTISSPSPDHSSSSKNSNAPSQSTKKNQESNTKTCESRTPSTGTSIHQSNQENADLASSTPQTIEDPSQKSDNKQKTVRFNLEFSSNKNLTQPGPKQTTPISIRKRSSYSAISDNKYEGAIHGYNKEECDTKNRGKESTLVVQWQVKLPNKSEKQGGRPIFRKSDAIPLMRQFLVILRKHDPAGHLINGMEVDEGEEEKPLWEIPKSVTTMTSPVISKYFIQPMVHNGTGHMTCRISIRSGSPINMNQRRDYLRPIAAEFDKAHDLGTALIYDTVQQINQYRIGMMLYISELTNDVDLKKDFTAEAKKTLLMEQEAAKAKGEEYPEIGELMYKIHKGKLEGRKSNNELHQARVAHITAGHRCAGIGLRTIHRLMAEQEAEGSSNKPPKVLGRNIQLMTIPTDPYEPGLAELLEAVSSSYLNMEYSEFLSFTHMDQAVELRATSKFKSGTTLREILLSLEDDKGNPIFLHVERKTTNQRSGMFFVYAKEQNEIANNTIGTIRDKLRPIVDPAYFVSKLFRGQPNQNIPVSIMYDSSFPAMVTTKSKYFSCMQRMKKVVTPTSIVSPTPAQVQTEDPPKATVKLTYAQQLKASQLQGVQRENFIQQIHHDNQPSTISPPPVVNRVHNQLNQINTVFHVDHSGADTTNPTRQDNTVNNNEQCSQDNTVDTTQNTSSTNSSDFSLHLVSPDSPSIQHQRDQGPSSTEIVPAPPTSLAVTPETSLSTLTSNNSSLDKILASVQRMEAVDKRMKLQEEQTRADQMKLTTVIGALASRVEKQNEEFAKQRETTVLITKSVTVLAHTVQQITKHLGIEGTPQLPSPKKLEENPAVPGPIESESNGSTGGVINIPLLTSGQEHQQSPDVPCP